MTSEALHEESAAKPQRSVRAVVVAILVAGAICAGLAWVFASPLASSPDDGYHQSSIWCPPPAEESGCEVQLDEGGEATAVSVPAILVVGKCFQFEKDVSASCQDEFDHDQPTWSTWFDRGGYPGGFYKVMNLFAGEDPTRSVLIMRTVNVVIAVGVLGTILLLADRPIRRLGLFSLLVSTVPLGMFVIGSVNPSGWAFVGLAGLFIGLHASLATESKGRRLALTVAAVVAATLAASARGDAGAYCMMAAVLIGFLHWGKIRHHGLLAVGPALVFLIGATGYLSAGQGAALGTGFGEDTGRDALHTLWYNIFEFPGVVLGMFGLDGGLGWLDTPMPRITSAGMLLVLGGIVLVGLRTVDWRKGLALCGLVAAIIALPLYMLQQKHNIVGEQVQSRYLLPLVPVILCVALMVGRTGAAQFSRAQAVTTWLVVTVAHSAALHTNINRYTVGLDNRVVSLNHLVEWWWSDDTLMTPMMVWIVGTLGFAVLAWGLVLVREDLAEAGAESTARQFIHELGPAGARRAALAAAPHSTPIHVPRHGDSGLTRVTTSLGATPTDNEEESSR